MEAAFDCGRSAEARKYLPPPLHETATHIKTLLSSSTGRSGE